MESIKFCGESFFLDIDEMHNYLLEKGIIISMMESNNSDMIGKFEIINNAYLLLLDIANKLDNNDLLESEYKFLENCCDELINRKIVEIASNNYELDIKKSKLVKLLDEVNNIKLLYPNLAKYIDTDVLKITNVINDTIIYKLIAI